MRASVRVLAATTVAALLAIVSAVSAGAAPSPTPSPAATASPTPGHAALQPKMMRQAAAKAHAPSKRKLAPFKKPPKLSPRSSAPKGTATPQAQAPLQQQAQPENAQTVSREVFGFVNAGNIADGGVGYATWNMSLLSTIGFFGLHVNGDGTLATNDTGWAEWNSDDLTNLMTAAHAAGVRVVPTIILQDNGGTMCSGLANGGTTVQQIVGQVEQKGADGVNVDYEGVNESCGGTTSRDELTGFVQQLRQALPGGTELTVDTYANSAADTGGFYDIPGMAASVDAFFVMAYDLDGDQSGGNWQYPPLSCSGYCFSPTSPLTGYQFNLTSTAQQYLGVVAGSKVILGLPYFGWSACSVPSGAARPGPNAPVPPAGGSPAPNWLSPTYLDSTGTPGTSGVGAYEAARDPHDTGGQDPYGTWTSDLYGCWRESTWDDPTSLGTKYDLVNSDNLRGAGIFTLDYGGGAPDLWNELATKFAVNPSGLASNGIPQSVSPSPGRVDVFWRGVNNHLWHRWNDGAWHGPEDLGGALVSAPAPVVSSSGVIDVFWEGSDRSLWHTWSINGTWNGPGSLGSGPLGQGPKAVGQSNGVIDVFWRGTDNGMWHDWYVGGWNGPDQLASGAGGGSLASDASPVQSVPGVLDVFWKGGDGNLWHRWYVNGWHGPQSLGSGTLGSGPQAVAQSNGVIDVVWRGTDNGMWHDWYVGGWHGTEQLAGGGWAGALTSDPSPVQSSSGVLDIFWRGADGSLWHRWYVGGWQGPASLGSGPLGSGPAATGQPTGQVDVFWRGSDDGLWHDWFAGGAWHGPESPPSSA